MYYYNYHYYYPYYYCYYYYFILLFFLQLHLCNHFHAKQYILATVSTEGTSHTDFTKVKLTRQSDINVESPTDTRGCYITDLAVLPGDLLLLTDYNNKSVKLADPASGQLLDHLQLPGKPHGLCLLPGDRAAVTIPGESTIHTILVTNKKLTLQDKIQLQELCFGIDFINDYFVV